MRWDAIQSVVENLTFSGSRNYIMAVSEGTLRALSPKEVETLRKDVTTIEKLEVEDVVKMKLFAFRLTEEISLELFTSFALAAKNYQWRLI